MCMYDVYLMYLSLSHSLSSFPLRYVCNCLLFLTGVDTRYHGDNMLCPFPNDSATSVRPTRERLPVTGSSTIVLTGVPVYLLLEWDKYRPALISRITHKNSVMIVVHVYIYLHVCIPYNL